jgi:hypothetical protein
MNVVGNFDPWIRLPLMVWALLLLVSPFEVATASQTDPALSANVFLKERKRGT